MSAVLTDIDVASRVQDLVSYIRAGRIMDAMREFYAEDIVMQENNTPPTVGFQANLAREQQFVDYVKRWTSLEIAATAVDADRGKTLVQSAFSFDSVDGKSHRYDQVSVQTWRDGKIVHEKFYYDAPKA